jgi:predicted acylesterase/phospholipase RssA
VARRYRILSIDGGGIRGIIPAVVLAEIEQRSGKRIADLFDMIAGTSTGGILSLALSAPGNGGAPRWSARDLVTLYLENGPVIFKRSIWRWVRSAGSILDEKYSADGFESVLKTYFGEVRLSAAVAEVLVTAYDIEGRDPFFFKRRTARESGDDDYPMWEAARATSSAPTYFDPFRVAGRLALIDGGVFATNPSMCAYADARRFEPGAELVLISLGTGQLERPIPYEEAKDWGMLEWARPILDVVFDGVADTTDYELRQVLDEGRYFRLQTSLDYGSDALDDVSATNMRALVRKGEELVQAADRQGFFRDALPLLS